MIVLGSVMYGAEVRFSPVTLIVGGILVLLGLAYILLTQVLPRRAYAAAKEKGLTDITVLLTPERVSFTNRMDTLSTEWSAVQEVGRTDEYIVIMTSNTVGQLIPRRAFAGDADFERFWETAQSYHRVRPRHN
jgi:hypothetical protein